MLGSVHYFLCHGAYFVAAATVRHPAGWATSGAAITRVWDRFKDAPWRVAIQAGLVPVSLGLIAASAFVLARVADKNICSGLVTALTVGVATFARINPLWLFAVGGLLGLGGFL